MHMRMCYMRASTTKFTGISGQVRMWTGYGRTVKTDVNIPAQPPKPAAPPAGRIMCHSQGTPSVARRIGALRNSKCASENGQARIILNSEFSSENDAFARHTCASVKPTCKLRGRRGFWCTSEKPRLRSMF